MSQILGKQDKDNQRLYRLLFHELPNYGQNVGSAHVQFNNLLSTSATTKTYLDKLTSIYDLDLFNLNTLKDDDFINNSDSSQQIRCRYFSPHNFYDLKKNLTGNNNESRFSIFHNKYTSSLRRNSDNLESHLLLELDYHFSIIGLTETNIITNANSDVHIPQLSGYNFEYAPTLLSSGGVGMNRFFMLYLKEKVKKHSKRFG